MVEKGMNFYELISVLKREDIHNRKWILKENCSEEIKPFVFSDNSTHCSDCNAGVSTW